MSRRTTVLNRYKDRLPNKRAVGKYPKWIGFALQDKTLAKLRVFQGGHRCKRRVAAFIDLGPPASFNKIFRKRHHSRTHCAFMSVADRTGYCPVRRLEACLSQLLKSLGNSLFASTIPYETGETIDFIFRIVVVR